MIVQLNGVDVEVKKYEYPGPFTVMTTRGEVKAQKDDYCVTFKDGSSCIIPSSALDPIIWGERSVPSEDELRYEKASGEILAHLEIDQERLEAKREVSTQGDATFGGAPLTPVAPVTPAVDDDLSAFLDK